MSNPVELANTQRDADRFMARLDASPDKRLECSTTWSNIRTRYEKHLTDAGLITRTKSPKGRKAWWVLTDAGREALPAALERYTARERGAKARAAADALEEHRDTYLGRAAHDLLAIARRLAGVQVPDDAPDDMPLNEPLTAGMVRAAKAAVTIAETPLPPED